MKNDTFPNRLKLAMRERNLRQVDVVNRTNISKSLLNKYLSGIAEPKSDKLEKLANALNVDVIWLLGYDVPMSADANVHLLRMFNSSKKDNVVFDLRNKLAHGLISNVDAMEMIRILLNNIDQIDKKQKDLLFSMLDVLQSQIDNK